ncbi:MAG: TVP38/TMEM64 family protein [Alkalispirochaetaceae bacterium]
MRRIGKSAAALLIIGAAVWLSVEYDLQGTLRDLLSWVEGQGAVGVITFIVAYIAATVLFIPGSILTLGAGFVFGVLEGVAYVSVASTLGATFAFLVGRYIAREWVSKKIAKNPRFSALDRAVSREGWKIVGLTRLSPIFPFNMLNYGYGLTGVSLPSYFFASWIGMLPGTVMYVYLGSLAGSLATLGAREGRTTAEWVFYSVGLIATVVVTFYVTRIARRVLSDRVEIPVEEK